MATEANARARSWFGGSFLQSMLTAKQAALMDAPLGSTGDLDGPGIQVAAYGHYLHAFAHEGAMGWLDRRIGRWTPRSAAPSEARVSLLTAGACLAHG